MEVLRFLKADEGRRDGGRRGRKRVLTFGVRSVTLVAAFRDAFACV